jgi:predicted metal-dependent hydrolase
VEQLDLALREFNRQAFYTAHELLELLWHDAYPPDRDFYQGLLQVAAGFYHIQQDNPNGAQILIGEGIYRLQKYPDRYLEVELGEFVSQARELLWALQQAQPLPPFPTLSVSPPTEYD